jgi:hypothetical protein
VPPRGRQWRACGFGNRRAVFRSLRPCQRSKGPRESCRV